jgi:hypothetical protein
MSKFDARSQTTTFGGARNVGTVPPSPLFCVSVDSKGTLRPLFYDTFVSVDFEGVTIERTEVGRLQSFLKGILSYLLIESSGNRRVL